MLNKEIVANYRFRGYCLGIANPTVTMHERGYKRAVFSVVFSVAVTIFGLALVFAGCNGRMEKASPQVLDQMESDWQSRGIRKYRIVVDVERPDELRRNDITVVDGQVTKGVLQFWEPHEKRWNAVIRLNESQALAFSVSGLFDTVRSELTNGGRPVVQVEPSKEPPFIKKIILGQIRQNNQAIAKSEATIIVQKFEYQR